MAGRLEDVLARKMAQQEGAAIDGRVERERWVKRVEELIKQIRVWLKPLADRKFLKVRARTHTILEEEIGSYDVTGLKIEFVDGQTVTIWPVGRYIIGGMGRVDVRSGTRTVMIVHKGDGVWEFAERTGRYGQPKTWPFNQATFEELLADIIEEE
jgi:hypothetical protein